MLALRRRVNEQIMLGDDITITVVEVRKGDVKLGIDAPKHVAIHRREVWLQIQESKKQEPEP